MNGTDVDTEGSYRTTPVVTSATASADIALRRIRSAWVQARAELMHVQHGVQSAQLATSRVLRFWRDARAEIQKLLGTTGMDPLPDLSQDPVRALHPSSIARTTTSETSTSPAPSNSPAIVALTIDGRGHPRTSIAFSDASRSHSGVLAYFRHPVVPAVADTKLHCILAGASCMRSVSVTASSGCQGITG
ncbi:hypothetical protein CF326_g9762 [Tilletia indica]|nr:hypothetical protein CF326_g9762 [Tilletia indica]